MNYPTQPPETFANVQGFAVDISFFGRQFLTETQVGPHSLASLNFDHVCIDQIFQESVRQIFDILSPDFQEVSVELLCLPDWKYFVRNETILANIHAKNALSESIKRLGMGIWLTLHNAGFFSQPKILVLHNVSQNLLYFWAHED